MAADADAEKRESRVRRWAVGLIWKALPAQPERCVVRAAKRSHGCREWGLAKLQAVGLIGLGATAIDASCRDETVMDASFEQMAGMR